MLRLPAVFLQKVQMLLTEDWQNVSEKNSDFVFSCLPRERADSY